MAPLINDSEIITVQRDYYDCHRIRAGDIVTINWSGNEAPLLKQVKAVPGDSLQLDGCQLLRNNRTLRTADGEPYCFDQDARSMLRLYTDRHIDGYLVLGQEPGGSLDSSEFGLISEDMITGRVRFPHGPDG